MDRECVLAVLVLLFCGSALAGAAWWPATAPVAASGRVMERRAWQRVWLPFAPATLLFAALCGWALVEPEPAEPMSNGVLLCALPFAAVLMRAAWRALRSAMGVPSGVTIGTVGLLRPRIVVSPRIAAALDAPALAAAWEHERAHARHRDPLRLWLAQLATDVLWPSSRARARLRSWRQGLELARDEEARLAGIDGADLATAILASLRLDANVPRNAVALGGDARFVKERIARLLEPVDASVPEEGRKWLLAGGVAALVAVVFGTAFGETLVSRFLVGS